jgi:methionyl-tRNA formyltransferase
MLASTSRPIGPDETSDAVEHDLARLGARLLIVVVDRLAQGSIEETPQDDAAATYAPRLTKADGLIDWGASAAEIHNRIRGLHPWPHAFTLHAGHRLILHRSVVDDAAAPAAPGTIVEAAGDRLLVATGAGILRITEIQPEGKRPLMARDFLAGHRLQPGERFAEGR